MKKISLRNKIVGSCVIAVFVLSLGFNVWQFYDYKADRKELASGYIKASLSGMDSEKKYETALGLYNALAEKYNLMSDDFDRVSKSANAYNNIMKWAKQNGGYIGCQWDFYKGEDRLLCDVKN